MANNNSPFGLKPVNMLGQPWNGQGMMVAFASNLNQTIFLGDPLIATGVTDGNGVPYVQLATAGAGNAILGAFLGPTNGPANSGVTLLQSSPIYVQANVLTYGFICADPDTLWEIQEDSVSGAIAAANAGFSTGNLTAGSGGSTATGLSSWMLQSSTVGTGGNSTYQVKVLGLARGPDNGIGNYARWTVRLNESLLNQPSAGV